MRKLLTVVLTVVIFLATVLVMGRVTDAFGIDGLPDDLLTLGVPIIVGGAFWSWRERADQD